VTSLGALQDREKKKKGVLTVYASFCGTRRKKQKKTKRPAGRKEGGRKGAASRCPFLYIVREEGEEKATKTG